MGLISVTDLDARQVEYADATQAQATIEDASAVVRACVAPVLDSVEAPDAPASIVAIVVAMVRRGLANPRGLQQETLGDYSYAAGSNAVATLLPTKRELRYLRSAAAAYAKAQGVAVPSWGVSATYMESDDIPAPPAVIDDITLPSDQR